MSEKKKPTMAEQALMEIEGNKPTMAEQAQMEIGGGDSSLPESRESTAIEGIKKFFSDAVDPQAYYEAGQKWGNPLVKGITKGAYFGLDDEVVGAIAGDKEKAKYKADQDEAEKTSPGLFLTGEMGSGLATPAGAITALKNVPGLAKLATTSPKLAKALAGMIAGGTQGGIAGAGYAEDDVADGAGYGAMFGAAIPGIAGGIGKLASYAPKGSTIFKKLFGLSDMEYDASRNLDLDTAKTPEQMGEFYQKIIDALSKKTDEAGKVVSSKTAKFEDLANIEGVGKPIRSDIPDFVEDVAKDKSTPFTMDADVLGKEDFRVRGTKDQIGQNPRLSIEPPPQKMIPSTTGGKFIEQSQTIPLGDKWGDLTKLSDQPLGEGDRLARRLGLDDTLIKGDSPVPDGIFENFNKSEVINLPSSLKGQYIESPFFKSIEEIPEGVDSFKMKIDDIPPFFNTELAGGMNYTEMTKRDVPGVIFYKKKAPEMMKEEVIKQASPSSSKTVDDIFTDLLEKRNVSKMGGNLAEGNPELLSLPAPRTPDDIFTDLLEKRKASNEGSSVGKEIGAVAHSGIAGERANYPGFDASASIPEYAYGVKPEFSDYPGGKPRFSTDPLDGLFAKQKVSTPKGTLSAKEIKGTVDKFLESELKVWKPALQKYEYKSPAAETVGKRIEEQFSRSLNGMYDFIPEDHIFDTLKSLTSGVDYSKASKTEKGAIKGIASKIKNAVYAQNPELQEAKLGYQSVKQHEDVARRLLSPDSMWSGGDQLLLPSDRSQKVERAILKPEAFGTKRFSDKLKEATGLDLESEALKRYVKESTSGGAPTSFYDRKGVDLATSLVAPIGVGAYTASQYGAGEGIGIGALGLGLGVARDKFGKRVGRNILQKLRTIPKEVDPMDYGSPTAAQLQKMAVDMATGGNKKLAATYYVLSQRNENLRKKKDE